MNSLCTSPSHPGHPGCVLPGGATGLLVKLHEDEFRTYHGPGAMAVRCATPHGPAIGHAAAELGRGRRVSDLGAELGLSPRTFTRRLHDHTGLAPKRFARIQRLQRMLAAVEPAGPADWARLAADHGYCDQAHLIDDFPGSDRRDAQRLPVLTTDVGDGDTGRRS